MNLIIDQGNTATKLAMFDGKSIFKQSAFLKEDTVAIDSWLRDNIEKISSVIISSVTNDYLDLTDYSIDKIIYLDDKTPTPVEIKYLSVKSLGKDRLANVVALQCLNPNNNSLSIDVGTCIKYDLINSKGEYLGGNISPGLKMRFKALHNQTDQLPLLNPLFSEKLYGNDTNSCIITGVQLGILNEINGFITRYSGEFKGLTIFMTGGDSKYFDKELKKPIFADSDLTLKGLNEILNYNVEKK